MRHLQNVDAGYNRKYTALGLMEVQDIFKDYSDEKTKKIAVVITNGFSSSKRLKYFQCMYLADNC